MAWLTATYHVASEPEKIEARAVALALEQSVECPLDAIGDPRVLDEIVARVAGITELAKGRYRVDLQLAVQTTGGEPAQTLNMLFGNVSLMNNVQLAGFDFPAELLAKFSGPRHGIAGIREMLGAPSRALTSVALKPQGLHVPELTAMCRTFAEAGVDIIKDDHGIANQAYSPFVERVRACQNATLEVVAATGKPVFYAPNLSATPRLMREQARFARDLGIRVVLVAPMLVGLPAFADLVEEFPDFVYLSHPSFAGASRIAPAQLFGRLFRMLGADASIFVNYGGRFSYPREDCAAIAEALRAPWGELRPALAVPAGGMLLERVDELLAFYGTDTMLLIGGNLLIARERLLERARDFVRRVENFGRAAAATAGE
jgi:ribulose-bisphosphate carboxylase large chain